MAIEDKTVVLTIRGTTDGIDEAKAKLSALGIQYDETTQRIEAQTTSFERAARAADPTYGALQRLEQQQAKLTSAYQAAIDTGTATQAVTDRYTTSLAALEVRKAAVTEKAAALAAAIGTVGSVSGDVTAAVGALGAAHEEAGLKSSQMREAMVLVHEMLSGNYKRAVGSATIELQNFGLMAPIVSAVMSPLGVAIGAVAVTTGVLTAANYAHHESIKAVADAYQLQGGAVGMSRSDLEQYAQTLASTGDISVKEARSIEAAALSAAQVPAEALKTIGSMAQDYAKAFDDGDLKKAAADLAQAYADPVGAAQKLDQQLNILSDTQKQQVINLTAQGDKLGAFNVLMDATRDRTKELADHGVGYLGQAWHALGNEISNVIDKMGKWGAGDTTKQQLESVKASLLYQQGDSGAQQHAAQLQAKYDAEQAKAALDAQAAATRELGKQAGDVARSYDANGTSVQKVKDDITLLTKAMMDGAIGADAYNAALAAMQAKLADLHDPLGATIRSMQDQAAIAAAATPRDSAWQSTLLSAQHQYNAAKSLNPETPLPASEVTRLQGQFNTTWGAQQGSRIASGVNTQDDLLAAAAVSPAALAYAKTQDTTDSTQAYIAGKNLLTQRQVTGQSEIAGANFDASQSMKLAAGYDDANKSVMALTASLAAEKEAFQGQIDQTNVAAVAQAKLGAAIADTIAKIAQQTAALTQQNDIQQQLVDAQAAGANTDQAARLKDTLDAQAQAADAVKAAQDQAAAALVSGNDDAYQAAMQTLGALTQQTSSLIDQKDRTTDLAQQQQVLNMEQSNQDGIAVAQAQLKLLTDAKAARKDEIDLIQYKQQLEHAGYTQAQQDELLASRTQLDDIKTQVAAAQAAQQAQQQEIKTLSDSITRDLATGFETAFKGGGNAWEKMLNGWHSMLDSFIANMIAQFLKTEIVVPIVTDVVGSVGGLLGGSSAGGVGGAPGSSSGIGSLLNLGSTANSASGLFGGPTIGSSLGLTGQGGLFSGVGNGINGLGANLFPGTFGMGTNYLSDAGVEALSNGSISGMENVGQAGVDFLAQESGGTLASGGSTLLGTLGGGLAAAGGGYLAGSLIGPAIGSPGLGALGGAGGGAAAGAMIGSIVPGIGTAIGAIVGAIAGAISGALGGQHPTVGPNATARIYGYDASTSTADIHADADNGGNVSQAQSLMQSSIQALQQTVGSLGGAINSLPALAMGSFKGKFFVDASAVGGPDYQSNQFGDAQSAVNAFTVEALKHSDISGLSADIKTAISNLNDAMSASDISNILGFASTFQDALSAMKTGMQDYTKSAQMAADQTAQGLTKEIDTFRQNTTTAGLDLSAANDAIKTWAGNLVKGADTTQTTTSQYEQSVEQLKANFNSLNSVLVDAGYTADQAAQMISTGLNTALKNLADQAKATMRATLNSAYGNDFLNQIQTVYTSLPQNIADAMALTGSGDMASQIANAQISQILNGLSPDQIGMAVSQFGDASKVGQGAAKSFLSLADSVLASKAAAEQNSTALQTANTNLNFFTNTAKSLSSYLSGLDTGSQSPLSPLDQYNSAKAQLMADQALAQTGNQDAMGRIQSDAQAFLAASKAYNASNAQYAADEQLVKQYIGQDVSYSQSQIAVEQQIVDSLNGNVLSELKAIEAAINKLEQGQFSGVANAGTTDSLVRSLYSSVLGMASPDQSGVSYWDSQYSQWVSQYGQNQATALLKQSFANAAGDGGAGSIGSTTTVAQPTADNIVRGFYSQTLGNNAPDQSGVSYWDSQYSQWVSQYGQQQAMNLLGQSFNNAAATLPGHATGGPAQGWFVAGEEGPEVVRLKSPGYVHTASQTRAMLGGGGNDNSALLAELQSLRTQVGQLTQVVAAGASQQVAATREQTGYVKRGVQHTARQAANPVIRAA